MFPALPAASHIHALVSEMPPAHPSTHPEGAVPTAGFSRMVTTLGSCVPEHPAQPSLVLSSVYFG